MKNSVCSITVYTPWVSVISFILPVSVCGSSPDKGVPDLLTSAWELVSSEPRSQHGWDPQAPPPSRCIIIFIIAIHYHTVQGISTGIHLFIALMFSFWLTLRFLSPTTYSCSNRPKFQVHVKIRNARVTVVTKMCVSQILIKNEWCNLKYFITKVVTYTCYVHITMQCSIQAQQENFWLHLLYCLCSLLLLRQRLQLWCLMHFLFRDNKNVSYSHYHKS